MLILGYISTIVMGISLGMLGGGGSILTVPILVYLFDVNPTLATAYSLFIVGLSAALGSFSYFKKKEIDFKMGALFAIPGFLGVFLTRYYVVPAIPDVVLDLGAFVLTKNLLIMLSFAIMMILASFSMIKKAGPAKEASQSPKSIWLIGLEGLVVGALTGFVGAGGGFLLIPALVVLGGLNMKKAVGTSLMIIAFKSLLGFTGDLMNHSDIDWVFLLSLVALAGVGIFIGSALASKIPERKLKVGFGYFVLVMGAFILTQQLFGAK